MLVTDKKGIMSLEPQEQPTYGVIDHYLGEKGKQYFASQGEAGIANALLNKHLWQPFISSKDDILDFGCGGGFLIKVLDAQRKVGVEVNPHARAQAKELGIETYPIIKDVPGKFDKVMSSHTLEHVPHPRQALLELKDKLRDEHSRLLLLLPLDDWRSRANKRYDPFDVNMHLHTWTPQLLGNLLSSCDLRVAQIRVVQHAWPPGKNRLWNISPVLFHSVARWWSIISKQRQLFAIAALK
jgi:SAM-dependent methyltransferase